MGTKKSTQKFWFLLNIWISNRTNMQYMCRVLCELPLTDTDTLSDEIEIRQARAGHICATPL